MIISELRRWTANTQICTVVFSIVIWMMASADPVSLDPQIKIRLVLSTAVPSGPNSVRIARDPRNNDLYYLKINGDIYHVNLAPGAGSTATRFYGAADHGLSMSVEGFAMGPDGTMYVSGNTRTNNNTANWVRISKGVVSGAGRTWTTLAQTQPYPLSRTAYDHLANGLVVSPDGQWLFANFGSRTDHGEIESTSGVYPNLRETGLTAKILRLPTTGQNLVLTNDLTTLKSAGYVFAEGTRNAFDLEFAPNGDLFATDNGPDRDMSDELNWIQQGNHYGFPWRMGGADNPQQFPGYNPASDHLLDPRYGAVQAGTYKNDPTFPSPPTSFTEPVINLGPNANSFRSPDGSIQASTNGQTVSTFTAHRSPLGLVFDAGALAAPYAGHGFVLGWTQGDPNGNGVAGPFKDAGQDLCDLKLTKLGDTNYQAQVTTIVRGFSNPIDAEIIGNKIYVIEYGGFQGIWELTFPASITVSVPSLVTGGFEFTANGPIDQTNTVSVSTNLQTWLPLTNFLPATSPYRFLDPASSGTPPPFRFYRVTVP